MNCWRVNITYLKKFDVPLQVPPPPPEKLNFFIVSLTNSSEFSGQFLQKGSDNCKTNNFISQASQFALLSFDTERWNF